MSVKHFITTTQFTRQELAGLLDNAARMKRGSLQPRLPGRNLVLLFFDPSLRTRTSFELAMQQLGGNVVTLNAGGDTWKLEMTPGAVMDGAAAEHVTDAARVLGRYADAIGIRAFPAGKSWEEDRRDDLIQGFVREAGVPIVNMESSLYHPNQALGDLLTIRERFGPDLQGLPITITWANHPNPLPMAVPNSILLACARFGMDIRFLRPQGYDLDPQIMDQARALCGESGGTLRVTGDVKKGYGGSRVVYAKSWGSIKLYGNREEEQAFRAGLKGWMVDQEKMDLTDGALFMHCLPVRRGVVVSDQVIDGERSVVYDQAENRLHAQKAVLQYLLG